MNELSFGARMVPPLERLAARMLENRDFHSLKTVVDLMVGLYRGGWDAHDDQSREYWLERMKNDFHPRAMGDSEYGMTEEFRQIVDLIDSEWRAVTDRNRST